MGHQYCYFDPATMQVEATYESAHLSTNANCEARGLTRALVPDGVVVTRNHRITVTDYVEATEETPAVEVEVKRATKRLNPVRPDHSAARATALEIAVAQDKLDNVAGLTARERELLGHRSADIINAGYDKMEAEG